MVVDEDAHVLRVGSAQLFVCLAGQLHDALFVVFGRQTHERIVESLFGHISQRACQCEVLCRLTVVTLLPQGDALIVACEPGNRVGDGGSGVALRQVKECLPGAISAIPIFDVVELATSYVEFTCVLGEAVVDVARKARPELGLASLLVDTVHPPFVYIIDGVEFHRVIEAVIALQQCVGHGLGVDGFAHLSGSFVFVVESEVSFPGHIPCFWVAA